MEGDRLKAFEFTWEPRKRLAHPGQQDVETAIAEAPPLPRQLARTRTRIAASSERRER